LSSNFSTTKRQGEREQERGEGREMEGGRRRKGREEGKGGKKIISEVKKFALPMVDTGFQLR
jgi:hypothetical protein